MSPTYLTEPLGEHHMRAAFACGVPVLDDYLRLKATDDHQSGRSKVYVYSDDGDTVLGYYTLSGYGMDRRAFPQRVRKLFGYDPVPAVLLGRLAIHQEFQGKGHGRLLIADALLRSVMSDVGFSVMIVDAKSDDLLPFYKNNGFVPFRDLPRRLWIALSTVSQAASL